MYQMMQPPGEALIQYKELEALLSFAPVGALPSSEWPWMLMEPTKVVQKSSKEGTDDAKDGAQLSPTSSTIPSASPAVLTSSSSFRDIDSWVSTCRNGDDVLSYSMNSTRTRRAALVLVITWNLQKTGEIDGRFM